MTILGKIWGAEDRMHDFTPFSAIPNGASSSFQVMHCWLFQSIWNSYSTPSCLIAVIFIHKKCMCQYETRKWVECMNQDGAVIPSWIPVFISTLFSSRDWNEILNVPSCDTLSVGFSRSRWLPWEQQWRDGRNPDRIWEQFFLPVDALMNALHCTPRIRSQLSVESTTRVECDNRKTSVEILIDSHWISDLCLQWLFWPLLCSSQCTWPDH